MTPILYLYALADQGPAGQLGEGITGEPLRLLSQGGVTAVAGELSDRPRPVRELLQAQDAVVRRLAERFEALLPARFGEVFAAESALAGQIAARARELNEALDLVRGCVQMNLRVFGDPEPAAETQPGLAAGPGTLFLENRRRHHQRARSLPEISPLADVLRPLLRAERLERQAAGRLLGTAYHLILRAQTAAYLDALEGARQRLGERRVAASGPWPPYAFAPEAGG